MPKLFSEFEQEREEALQRLQKDVEVTRTLSGPALFGYAMGRQRGRRADLATLDRHAELIAEMTQATQEAIDTYMQKADPDKPDQFAFLRELMRSAAKRSENPYAQRLFMQSLIAYNDLIAQQLKLVEKPKEYKQATVTSEHRDMMFDIMKNEILDNEERYKEYHGWREKVNAEKIKTFAEGLSANAAAILQKVATRLENAGIQYELGELLPEVAKAVVRASSFKGEKLSFTDRLSGFAQLSPHKRVMLAGMLREPSNFRGIPYGVLLYGEKPFNEWLKSVERERAKLEETISKLRAVPPATQGVAEEEDTGPDFNTDVP